MSVGDRIIELRKQAGLSQKQLAEAMDVSRQAVSKWETGQALPDSIKMIRLAEILDTDIEYLSTGRRNFERCPPIVVKATETVEKIVEKPVIQIVERVVVKEIEKPVIQYIDRPVYKKVYRTQYIRSKLEYLVVALAGFFLGLLLGSFL